MKAETVVLIAIATERMVERCMMSLGSKLVDRKKLKLEVWLEEEEEDGRGRALTYAV